MQHNHHITKLIAGDRVRGPHTGRRTKAAAPAVASGAHERLRREQVAELMSRATAGEEQRWEDLVHEFGGLIRAVARAHRLNEADAADVAQSTWLRLLEHAHRLDTPGSVGAWLATTARRECLRVLRGAKREVPFGDDPPEPPSGDAPPDQAILTSERNRTLWRSFARLRTTDQTLLALLISDDAPAYCDIAHELNMPIGSIGPTRARALERLRGALEQDDALALLRN